MAQRKKGAAPRETQDEHGNTWTGAAPVSDEDLAAIERALGLTLPPALRSFMQRFNGAKPRLRCHRDDRHEVEVGTVIPLHPANARVMSFEATCRVLFARPDFERGFVPFATDTGNANYFCVDTRSGAVLYWRHDEPESPRMDLAPSLDRFLAELQDVPY